MEKKGFGGAFKKGESILGPWEKAFVLRWVNRIPNWLETYHLTLLTLVWTGFGNLLRMESPRLGTNPLVLGSFCCDCPPVPDRPF